MPRKKTPARVRRATAAGLKSLELHINRYAGGWPPPPPLHFGKLKRVQKACERLSTQVQRIMKAMRKGK
jgi:hypothetical protein